MNPLKYPIVKVGDTFTTKTCGDCVVTAVEGKGTSRSYATVKFIATGGVSKPRVSELRKGHVRDRKYPSVYGVGYLGEGPHKANDPAYDLWYAVLQRCYNPKNYNSQNQKTYKHVSVCKEWHNYQNFADFYVANYVDGYHLDKDLLNPNSKTYSPKNCLFLPREVNLTEALLRKLIAKYPSYNHVMEAFRLQAIASNTV